MYVGGWVDDGVREGMMGRAYASSYHQHMYLIEQNSIKQGSKQASSILVINDTPDHQPINPISVNSGTHSYLPTSIIMLTHSYIHTYLPLSSCLPQNIAHHRNGREGTSPAQVSNLICSNTPIDLMIDEGGILYVGR